MTVTLPSLLLRAGEMLQHVSRVDYRDEPLWFGRDGVNRYDAPNRNYGVLYLGRDLPTALMESVFHKHQWFADAKRPMALEEIQSRMVRAVGVQDNLRLADLTAPGVMAGYFGLNLEQFASRDYAHTQQVSAKVHGLVERGLPIYDGLLYPSRNNYPEVSIALFDRARLKVEVTRDIDLAHHSGWPGFVEAYDIIVELDPGPAERDEEA